MEGSDEIETYTMGIIPSQKLSNTLAVSQKRGGASINNQKRTQIPSNYGKKQTNKGFGRKFGRQA